MQACETDVTFVLKLILQTQGEYVVFPVLFISLYEIALFIEVELVIGLHADMLVETVQSADAECALGEVGLGGQAVFNADLIPFQLGVGIINVVFQDGRERSGSDVVHQIEKVADERTLEQGVLRFIGRACPLWAAPVLSPLGASPPWVTRPARPRTAPTSSLSSVVM